MKKITFLATALLMSLGSFAQQALFDNVPVISPEVNANHTVTFRLKAPNAQKVQVTGDFLAPKTIDTPMGKYDAPGVADMTKDEKGVWTFTSQMLSPELYSYNLLLDGVKIVDPGSVYITRDITSETNIFILSDKKGDCGDLYTVNEVPHGNVSKVWYDSPTLKMQRRMTIYTPAGYDKGKDYPVLYLLHGAGGDEDAWTTLGRAQHILDNLIATGKAKPMVVVMTNGNPNCQAAPGEWSAGQYIPSFYGYQGAKPAATMDESFPDVMNYVESHYKVAKDKARRAICGLSMGGGHSFDISRRFPTKFDYIGLFSAGLHVGTTGDFRSCRVMRRLRNSWLLCLRTSQSCIGLVWARLISSTRAVQTCVATSMRRGINIPIWRRRVDTSGVIGVCILQSSHRRFSNDRISFSSNSFTNIKK